MPLFNDKIQQEIDEWLYVMKHSEVPKHFKSPYMQKVEKRLAVLKMSQNERNKYFKYLKESVHNEDVIESAVEKGKKEEKIVIAKNLLSQGVDVETIAIATGLSIDKIESIRIG